MKPAIVKSLPTHGELSNFGGWLIHTTGDGIPSKYYKANHLQPNTLLSYAVSVYEGMAEGPHFVIAPDGSYAAIRDVKGVAWHAGISAEERQLFLTGHWETSKKLIDGIVDWWQHRWPTYKSPSHLYPSTSVNKDYIGIELVPAGTYVNNSWAPVLAHGRATVGPRGRFTINQYVTLAKLVPYGLSANRFLGHEDVNPITRPGWDPGDKLGAFDWKFMHDLHRALTEVD